MLAGRGKGAVAGIDVRLTV